jgi:ABC-type transporter MlaC component
MKTLMTVTLLAFAIGSATASAQAPAAPPAKMTADEKKAISKTCSDQANQKGLHGKDRKKFRAACIKSGGKSQ